MPAFGVALLIGSTLGYLVSQNLLTPDRELRSRLIAFIWLETPVLVVLLLLITVLNVLGNAYKKTGGYSLDYSKVVVLLCPPTLGFLIILGVVSNLRIERLVLLARGGAWLVYLLVSTISLVFLTGKLGLSFLFAFVLALIVETSIRPRLEPVPNTSSADDTQGYLDRVFAADLPSEEAPPPLDKNRDM